MRIVGRNYRHKIEIWDLSATVENEIGENIQAPTINQTLWAEVMPVRGKEYLENQKINAELVYKITTRYRGDIDPSMIVKWQGRELNINAIIDISGREEHMELMCTERVM